MKSELDRTINQVAHFLAARSFNTIRLRLREQARTLLKQGHRPEEVALVIQEADMRRDMQVPAQHSK